MTNLTYVNISARETEPTSAAVTAERKRKTLPTYSFCFFVLLHEIFASQLTEQRISIFHFHRAIMKRRSYFTSLTFGERLKLEPCCFSNISLELPVTKSGVGLNPVLCVSGVYLLCSRYSAAVTNLLIISTSAEENYE